MMECEVWDKGVGASSVKSRGEDGLEQSLLQVVMRREYRWEGGEKERGRREGEGEEGRRKEGGRDAMRCGQAVGLTRKDQSATWRASVSLSNG